MCFCVLCKNSRLLLKWRENNFWENSPVESANTLRLKNFVKIALSCNVSEINAFFCVLRRNSRWPPQMAGKPFLEKVVSRICRFPKGQKFCRDHSILYHYRDKCVFVFYAEIGRQKMSGNDFWEKLQ